MFPAIKDAWREIRSGFGSQPHPMELKAGASYEDVSSNWLYRNGFYGLGQKYGSSTRTWSGESVTLDTAMQHSVFWACIRLISETAGCLPLALMQDTDKGKFPAKNKPAYNLLKNAPNSDMGTMEFRESRTAHALGAGNGFARIYRRSGTGEAIEFQPLMPEQITGIDRDSKNQVNYLVKEGNEQEKAYPVIRNKPHDIFHLKMLGYDGLSGYSVVAKARQSIGTAIGMERFAGKFIGNGGRAPYALNLEGKPFKDDQTFAQFRQRWDEVYSDPFKAPILEPWLKYQTIGMSLADCQLLQSRQFSIPEVCRWFLISPHLVGDLSRATFSNIEQLQLGFVKNTLTAWLVRWEQALWRCVLTPEEQNQGYFFRHNVNGLLRGDFKTRMEGYSAMLQNGIANRDEIRDLEDWNPIPDGAGQDYTIQLNMQTLPASQLVTLGPKPNPNALTDEFEAGG